MSLAALALVLAACNGTGGGNTTTTGGADTTVAESDTTTTEASTTTAGQDGGEATINIVNFSFNGAQTVDVGTTVTAVNQDGVTHTWTSDDDVWNSGGLSSGDSFEFTFDEPGEFSYFCSIHPQMTGTITVEG